MKSKKQMEETDREVTNDDDQQGENICDCGDDKDPNSESCSFCLEKSKLKCKICHYFLDPSLCFACNKSSNQKRYTAKVVRTVRDNVIVPEHLVYAFQQRRPKHPKNQQLEEASFNDQCEQE
jgi:hypothetical protein